MNASVNWSPMRAWDFDTALTAVRSSTVFTTHTPVQAGIDRFPHGAALRQ